MTDNPWDTMRAAIREAREADRAIEQQANAMAELLTGRLRKVVPYHLKALKRELRNFDMVTGRWKNK